MSQLAPVVRLPSLRNTRPQGSCRGRITSAWRSRRVAGEQQTRAQWARWASLLTVLIGTALGGDARASEGREGWTFDLRLGAGLATNTYDESDRPIADFEATVIGGGLRLGGFVSPDVLLGFELAVLWGGGIGELRVHEPEYFYQDYPRGDSYGYFSPLGVFIELYPWQSEGLFVNLGAGVGLVELPNFYSGGIDALMARYALELGYELSRNDKLGPAFYLHFERWAGAELAISTDYPAGLESTQLLAGLRWSM